MRIIILLRILWTAGAQKIAVEEYRALRDLGHDVKIVFLRSSDFRGYEDMLTDVNYRVVRKGRSGVLTPIFAFLTKKFMPDRGVESTVDYDLIHGFPKIAEKEQPDLVICHDQWAGLAGFYAHRELGIPYRVFIHERVQPYGGHVLGRIAFRIEHQVLHEANSVFAVTDPVAHSITSTHGIGAVTNFPGLDSKVHVDFSGKTRTVVCAAMWDAGRHPESYIPLFRTAKDFEFKVVGNWRIPRIREEFVSTLISEGMQSRVQVLSGVTNSELGELYRRAMFSVRFGFGEYGPSLGTIEAIQHGVPPVVNRELGISSLIDQFQCGLVASTMDPQPIHDWLVESGTRSAYTRLQANLKRLASEYTWKDHAMRLAAGV